MPRAASDTHRGIQRSMTGGLFRKIMTMVGGGAKVIKYFSMGPEYLFPGNCYSERPYLDDIFSSMNKAHGMVAEAEVLLGPGKRVAASIAILSPRSSFVWDVVKTRGELEWSTNQTEHNSDYEADVYGIYVALAVHSALQIEFMDEDDLNDAGLQQYKMLVITEPNVPSEGLRAVTRWMQAGGVLLTTAGAARWDRYNSSVDTIAEASGVLEVPRRRHLMGVDFQTGHQWASSGHGTVDWETAQGSFRALGNRSFASAAPASKSVVTRCRFADDGSPAVVSADVDAGSHFHFYWLPGLSYLENATNWARLPTPDEFPSTIRSMLQNVVAAASRGRADAVSTSVGYVVGLRIGLSPKFMGWPVSV